MKKIALVLLSAATLFVGGAYAEESSNVGTLCIENLEKCKVAKCVTSPNCDLTKPSAPAPATVKQK